MHEASAAEALVRILGDFARARAERGESSRIALIRLVVGESNGYMEESLAFYLGVLGKGTPIEGARLEMRYVKPLLRCPSCGLSFERRRFSFDCPECGGNGVMTDVGREFYVDSVEMEE